MAEFTFSGRPDEKEIEATGDHEKGGHKLKSFPFEKYIVVIKLTDDDRILGIEEIQVRKDFLTRKQRFSRIGFQDLEDIYRE